VLSDVQQLMDAVARQDIRNTILVLAYCKHDHINTPYSKTDTRTALHIAAALGNLVLVQLLLWVCMVHCPVLSRMPVTQAHSTKPFDSLTPHSLGLLSPFAFFDCTHHISFVIVVVIISSSLPSQG